MSHEWIKEVNGLATVGLTKAIAEEIGEIVFVNLPEVARRVVKEEQIAILESTKAAIDLYSPVTGLVVAINKKLLEYPQLLNKDPEGEGWLYQIKISY